MFIQQIIIQGFKSYKDQTVIEPFSPKHNVVVGRNGSGKSNFFFAIRFVLADAYANMSREERQALLHEGTGPATMSAYVEIIFDNADSRFPTGREQVILRRTIGLKKDEYSLDRKSVPKSEVMSLLESAGFSRSNPYYIVPQGRITSLCNAKDHERLQLLKEVAGTRVYEQRRQESLKIMQETDARRGKIEELLKYIEERLAELEEEKEELRLYYDLDRDRRSMEYTIYQRELTDVNENLERLEEDRNSEIGQTAQMRHHAHDRERVLAELETELKAARHQLQLLRAQKMQIAEEKEEQTKTRANVELLLRDLEESVQTAESSNRSAEKKLRLLEQEIVAKEQQLETVTQSFQSVGQKESAIEANLANARQLRQLLVSKRGRQAQFRNKKDRDSCLKKEVQSVSTALDAEQTQQSLLEQELAQAQARVATQETDLEKLRALMEKDTENTGEHSTAVKELKKSQMECNSRRKELWRQDAQLDAAIANYREEYRRSLRALNGSMDKNTCLGLEAVQKIAQRLQLPGVHGPLFELFDLDERYHNAVEVTAGQSLFHVVVDSDETVARILDVMSREKSGRVTFMPLNRLNPSPVEYPNAKDALPMIQKLRFDPKFQAAFEQVFSKTIICPNLEIAGGYAKSHGLNAITLDGDRVERKGALTGGFHDNRRSRLETIQAMKSVRTKLDAEQSKSAKVKAELAAIETQSTKIQSELQLIETKRRRLQSNHDLMAKEAANLSRELVRLKEGVASKQKHLQTVMGQVTALRTQLNGLNQELSSPFSTTLTAQEMNELESLEAQIADTEREFTDVASSRAQFEAVKNRLESELEMNLKRSRDELHAKLTGAKMMLESGGTGEEQGGSVEAYQAELKALQVSLKQLDQAANESEKNVDESQARVRELQASMEKIQYEQTAGLRSLEEAAKQAEQFLARRSILQQKKTECTDKIRSLGALPDEAFEKFVDVSTRKLVKELHKVNEQLKKYSHVNKKAFEQYTNFTKQRDSLQARKKELDTSNAAIQDLITVLDQRKDEAIEASFQQVCQNFREIFERLVPAGRGELVMHRRDVDSQESMESAEDGSALSESYCGIGIRVSFNSKTEEGLLMQQLSGGQKSLVALAMIFAIQKCDPAPFYLFDEIDANLDAAYRTSVANMIHELSEHAQFITTTFRPEMLRHADKFYGVTFRNRVSRVDVITKEDATNFVEQAH